MKKVIFMLVALVALSATAQERGPRKHKKDRAERFAEFSPEEIAELNTKKLTLALDLNTEQQKQIQALELEKTKARREKMAKRKEASEKGEKPSKEEHLAKMNSRLDQQIEAKAQMKKLLNEEQYAKWEKLQIHKGKKLKKRRAKHKK